MNAEKVFVSLSKYKNLNFKQSLPFVVNDNVCWFDFYFEHVENLKYIVHVPNILYFQDDVVSIKSKLSFPFLLQDEFIKDSNPYYQFFSDELMNANTPSDINLETIWKNIEETVLTGFIDIYHGVEKEFKKILNIN